jgi:hypothetical protein
MYARCARAVAVVCALAVAGVAGPAAAKPAAHGKSTSKTPAPSHHGSSHHGSSHHGSSSHSSSHASSSRHHHGTSAHRADNMPPGWVWPPSRGMRQSGAKCLAELDALGVKYKRAGAQKKIATPITVPSMQLGGLELKSIWRSGPFVMDCELALALESYGPKLHALGVRQLQFARIWGYTNVRTGGQTKPFLSRHALGLAIDVYAFVDDTGRKAVVETDYPNDDPLLLAVEQTVDDSGGFRLCLTPKNDPVSHHDHFHIEAKIEYPVTTPSRVSARSGRHRAAH